MPRGRPKKNFTDTEKKTTSIEVEKKPTSATAKEKTTTTVAPPSNSKKKEEFPICVCCKSHVYSKRRLNLTLLTTLAPYYFDITDSQPYICSKCAVDLGKVINNFFVKHGAEVKPYSQTGIKSENVLEEKL